MYLLDPAAIDELRDARGFTSDKEVAQDLGVSLGSIQKIRAKSGQPSLRVIVPLLKSLGRTNLFSVIIED